MATQQEILDGLAEIVNEVAGVPAADVQLEKSFVDDLDIDSLSMVEVVVAAAHSMMGRGREASLHVDGDGHRRLIDVAREQGVRHIVYVSVYAGDPAFTAVPFFRIKPGVERHLQASGVSFTVLRPTAFMDFHAHVLIGEPLIAGKRVVVLGQGTRPRNLVAATDVAQIIIQAVADRSLINQTIDVGGPENLTTMEVVRLYEDALGRKARVTHVPIGLVRAASTLLGPVQGARPDVANSRDH